MKKLNLTILLTILTGCDVLNTKMEVAKSTQICKDNNTTYYKHDNYAPDKHVVTCSNGLIFNFTEDEFVKIHGKIVEKYIRSLIYI